LCKFEYQQQQQQQQCGVPPAEHAIEMLQYQARTLASLTLSGNWPPAIERGVYDLCFSIIKLRLLVGALTTSCHNLQPIIMCEPGPFDPGKILHELLYALQLVIM